MVDRMGDPGPPGGDSGKGATPEDSRPVEPSSEDPQHSPSVVFCVFPHIEWLVSISVSAGSGLRFYDSAKLPQQQPTHNWQRTLSKIKPRGGHLFPEEVSLGFEEFLAKIQVNPDERPEDSHRASIIRYYVLARSSAFLVHLDVGVNSPEMMLASLAGIPIVGVSERYVFSPQVINLVDILVKPQREFIVAAIRGAIEAGESPGLPK